MNLPSNHFQQDLSYVTVNQGNEACFINFITIKIKFMFRRGGGMNWK